MALNQYHKGSDAIHRYAITANKTVAIEFTNNEELIISVKCKLLKCNGNSNASASLQGYKVPRLRNG
jgi:hypothetical protein